jgi:hypothetical protein
LQVLKVALENLHFSEEYFFLLIYRYSWWQILRVLNHGQNFEHTRISFPAVWGCFHLINNYSVVNIFLHSVTVS